MIRDPPAPHDEGDSFRSPERRPLMTLLEACKAGDEAAWRRLFQERSGQIYRWAVLLGLGSADAEDASQEVLAIAARRIDTCRALLTTRRVIW